MEESSLGAAVTGVKTEAPVCGAVVFAGAAFPRWCGSYTAARDAGAPRVGIQEQASGIFLLQPQGEGFESDAGGLILTGSLHDALAQASEMLAAHLQALS